MASYPGKLFVAGEWAVLLGYWGLVTSVFPEGKGILEISAKKGKRFIIDSDMGKIGFDDPFEVENEELSFVINTIRVISKLYGIDRINLKIRTVFKGASLGSSASVTVGTIKEVLNAEGIKESEKRVFSIAYLAHTLITQEKVGSGFDVASITYERPIWYKNKLLLPENKKMLQEILKEPFENAEEILKVVERNVAVEFAKIPFEKGIYCEVLPAFKTPKMVKEKMKEGKIDVLHEIGREVEKFRKKDRKKDEFQEFLRKIELLLRKWGVTTEEQERICDEIWEKFGIGAKMTGAGGDNVFALVDDGEGVRGVMKGHGKVPITLYLR